jgi:hypothetical protein
METPEDMLSRVRLMGRPDTDWDLSDNETAAIRYLLGEAAKYRESAAERDQLRAQLGVATNNARHYANRTSELEAQVADLRGALEEAIEELEAVKVLAVTDPLRLALYRTAPQSLGRLKAEALREFAKSRDVEVIGNGDWYGGIQAERTATVDDLRETADRMEKEAPDA